MARAGNVGCGNDNDDVNRMEFLCLSLRFFHSVGRNSAPLPYEKSRDARCVITLEIISNSRLTTKEMCLGGKT